MLLVAGTPVQVGVRGSAQKAASPHAPAASISHLFGSLLCYYLHILRMPLKGLLETGK